MKISVVTLGMIRVDHKYFRLFRCIFILLLVDTAVRSEKVGKKQSSFQKFSKSDPKGRISDRRSEYPYEGEKKITRPDDSIPIEGARTRCQKTQKSQKHFETFHNNNNETFIDVIHN